MLFMKPRESEDIKPRLCAIQSTENHFILKPGMRIGKFFFNEIRSSSSHGAVYYLEEAFFLIDEKFFHLYQIEKASGSNSLRIEQYPVHWGDQLKRTIEDTEAMIREVKYVGRALKWFEAETAEGFIYFCAGDSEELLFYKSSIRQEAPQKADKGHCKDQLKKINFI